MAMAAVSCSIWLTAFSAGDMGWGRFILIYSYSIFIREGPEIGPLDCIKLPQSEVPIPLEGAVNARHEIPEGVILRNRGIQPPKHPDDVLAIALVWGCSGLS